MQLLLREGFTSPEKPRAVKLRRAVGCELKFHLKQWPWALTIGNRQDCPEASARNHSRGVYLNSLLERLGKPIGVFHIHSKICSISTVRRSRVNRSCASEVTPLIKQDIVHHVIERTGLPRTKAEAAVDTVFEGLKQALSAGERIELRGFGVFSVRARKTGIGRNPRTGTEVSITPGKAVRFKPGKELHALETGASSEDGK